jgi:hypothetical protein
MASSKTFYKTKEGNAGNPGIKANPENESDPMG